MTNSYRLLSDCSLSSHLFFLLGFSVQFLLSSKNPNNSSNNKMVEDREEDYYSPSYLGPKYKTLKILGQGAFGKVFMAENTETSQVVAIKCLKHNDSSYLSSEINALCIMRNHPNIIRLEDMYRQSQSGLLRLVFEYMDHNLLDVIEDRRARKMSFSEFEIRNVCFQILQGIDYMHRTCGYMHRDLKPENILVKGDNVKIADLGSAAKLVSPYTEYRDYVTTRWYRAPEVLFGHIVYGSAVDMWALGTIMAEMYMLKPLFPGINKKDQLMQITRFPMSTLSDLMPEASSYAIDLMKSLLSLNPNLRPTASEALCHDFFFQPLPFSSSIRSSCYAQVTAPLPPVPSCMMV